MGNYCSSNILFGHRSSGYSNNDICFCFIAVRSCGRDSGERPKKLRTDKRSEIEKQLEIAQKLSTKLKEQRGADDSEVDAAVKSLKDAKKQEHEFDKESKVLKQNYKVFTVYGGVIFPACFFLAAMVLSALAWGLGASGEVSFYIGGWRFYTTPFLYGLVPASLVLIGFGIARLHSSLQRIREVAITAEEITMRRDVETFKTAYRELEAEAAPILTFSCFKPDHLPIRIEAEEQIVVTCALELERGQVAEDISVYIYAPAGFDFPDLEPSKKWLLDDKQVFPGYLMRKQEISRLKKGLIKYVYFTIKAPSKIGTFKIKYDVNCKGLERLPGEIGIKVIPKSQSIKV